MASVDFFTVPTVSFRVLFVFVVLAHHRRRVVHFNVTEHPTAAWTAQQILEAFPEDTVPRYLMRDRDQIYGECFRNGLRDGHHRSSARTAKPLAKSVCGKAGGLHPARVLRPRDRAGRQPSATNPEELFRLLSGFENPPILSQGRSDLSRRAGAGGWRLWGSRRSADSTIATNGALRNRWQDAPAFPHLENRQTGSRKARTCRRKGSTNPMTSQTRYQTDGRHYGPWMAIFAASATLSSFGEGHLSSVSLLV